MSIDASDNGQQPGHLARRLGDRVGMWATHNEPWVAAFLGHYFGDFAPGHTDLDETLRVAHHLLLAHGRSVPIIRGNAPNSEVGIILDCRPSAPASAELLPGNNRGAKGWARSSRALRACSCGAYAISWR